MFQRCLMAALALGMMYGCANTQNPPPNAGAQTIQFSVSAMTTYRGYTNKDYPKVFVVTADGERGFYTYCSTASNEKCRDNTAPALLKHCRETTSKRCDVFANNGEIVWKNPGTWQTAQKTGMHFFVDHKGIESHKL